MGNLKNFAENLKNVCIVFGILLGGPFLVIYAAVVINDILESYREGELEAKAAQATQSPTEFKPSALDVSYDGLMRNYDPYRDKTVHFTGKVLQSNQLHGDLYELTIGTKTPDFDDDIIWVNYVGNRVSENDIVELWGAVKMKESLGSYGTFEVPGIHALILDVIQKQGESSAP